ncbi:hypothetical protein [Sphingomonas sp. MMS24-J13]|uniref:hypothetical protein n=1 Tax=Sphingomonas sp. MMS24-J13 TaxID=3238686 RepID=UPI00384F71AC
MSPLPNADRLAADAIALLTRLVAFDTTSRDSNLALIEHVEALLTALGVASTRVPNHDGTKANLFATLGPAIEGGSSCRGIPMWCPSMASPGRAIPGR